MRNGTYRMCGLDILTGLDKIAVGHAATPAQIPLAWLLAQPGLTAPLVSAASVAQWLELTKAPGLKLDDVALSKLDKVNA